MKSKTTGRIETKSSRTAAFMCLARAASYMDTRECYLGKINGTHAIVTGIKK